MIVMVVHRMKIPVRNKENMQNNYIVSIKKIIILLFLCYSFSGFAQNRPYVDDKLLHFGFSIGINFMDYGTRGALEAPDGVEYAVRTKNMLPGFSVGLVSDLRLCRYLNLRFCPAFHFGQKTLTYHPINQENMTNKRTEVLSLPLTVPLYLKWSAEREMNYRPYLIGGGGISFDFGPDKKRPILQRRLDYFVEVGFGVDFYFSWFKLCPQLTYSIGFNNVLVPVAERPDVPKTDQWYTNALDKLISHQINLTFNFE